MEIANIALSSSITKTENGTDFARKENSTEAKKLLQNEKNSAVVEKKAEVQTESDMKKKQVEKQQELSKESLEKITRKLKEFIDSTSTTLSFRLDEKSGRHIVTVYETSSGKIIRQIPDNEILEIFQRLENRTLSLIEEFV